MKLVQLNMWWGGKLEGNILQFIKEESPDILCLQEACSTDMNDSGFLLPIEKIQATCDFPYAIFAPSFTMQIMRGQVSFGNAILSKLPITDSHYFFTHLDHIDNFDFNHHDDYNVRNLLHCSIKTKSGSLDVLTHHGYHIHEHKNGTNETDEQMRQVHDYLSQLAGPKILTGDFNLAPHSKSLEIINKSLTNLSIKHKLKTTRNQLTHKQEVCDYIFVNDEIKVSHFEASNEIISDHQALLMEFDV